MVDHVSGAVFAFLTSTAVSDYVINAMMASVANWGRTDTVLKSDGEASCKSIQGRFRNARSAPTIAPNSPIGHGSNEEVERMIQEGSRPMLGNHNQGRHSRAVWSEPSDSGLGCPTRCLAAHTVPSEELGRKSALFAVWTKVLGRDRTRGDCVLQVRWDTRQAVPARERASTLSAIERGACAARTICKHATSGRWCSDKIRWMVGTRTSPKPKVVHLSL